jgi:hypothetical protein
MRVGVASRLQLAVAALLIAVTAAAGVAGLALSEPDDATKRWLCTAALILALVGGLAWLVAWNLRARTVASMVATASRIAALVHASDDLSSEARKALTRWAGNTAPAQIATLLEADAYAAAQQVQCSWAEVLATVPVWSEGENGGD